MDIEPMPEWLQGYLPSMVGGLSAVAWAGYRHRGSGCVRTDFADLKTGEYEARYHVLEQLREWRDIMVTQELGHMYDRLEDLVETYDPEMEFVLIALAPTDMWVTSIRCNVTPPEAFARYGEQLNTETYADEEDDQPLHED